MCYAIFNSSGAAICCIAFFAVATVLLQISVWSFVDAAVSATRTVLAFLLSANTASINDVVMYLPFMIRFFSMI